MSSETNSTEEQLRFPPIEGSIILGRVGGGALLDTPVESLRKGRLDSV